MRAKRILPIGILFFFVLPLFNKANAATFSLNPSTQTVNVNDEVRIELNIDTEGSDVILGTATLVYNPAVMQIVNIEPGSFFSIPLNSFAQGSGALKAGGQADFTATANGSGLAATLVFRAVAEGNSTLVFSCGTADTDSQIHVLDQSTRTVTNALTVCPTGGSYNVVTSGAPTPIPPPCDAPNSCQIVDPLKRVPGVDNTCPGFLPRQNFSCPDLPIPTSGDVLENWCCPPTLAPGQAFQTCDSCGWCAGQEKPPDWQDCRDCHDADGRWTAIGCVPTTPGAYVQTLLQVIFSLTGGIAFLALLYGAGLILTSRGNTDRLQQGKSIIRGAVIGLILVFLSVFILEFIGVTVFGLPGFGG